MIGVGEGDNSASEREKVRGKRDRVDHSEQQEKEATAREDRE